MPGGIFINNDVTNYGGVPSAGAGLLANRPAAGVVGRLFIGTDTNIMYRDTGTAWVTIGSSGPSGSGAAGQATFWTGAAAISGDNAFFWDNTNKRLGLGTNTPGVRLDAHGTGVIAQFNGTGTNDSFIDFQNAGSTQWRIGNAYLAGTNRFFIYNAAGATQLFTILQGGNIGIGSSFPAVKLDIQGPSGVAMQVFETTSGLNNRITISQQGTESRFTSTFSSGTAFFTYFIGGTEVQRIDTTGNVGIGYAATINNKLSVNGTIYQGSNTANSNFQMLCSANFYTGGFSPNFFTYTSGPVTIPLTNTGLVFKTAATITATLPAASGINNQYYIVVLTGTVVTLNRAGSDTIVNTAGASVTSLTLTGYTKTLLYCDGGTTWYQLF